MKLIRKLGSRLSKNGYKQSYGIFWCDFCKQEVEKTLSHGYRDKSCGCRKGCIKHGETDTRLYKIWKSMKYRCSNSNTSYYKYYGGRGITICPEWTNDYITFRDWAMSNGYKEGLEIDRRNTDDNYEPNNCRWVTHKENMRNTRQTKLTLEIANEIRTLWSAGNHAQKELALLFSIDESHINNIIKNRKWV